MNIRRNRKDKVGVMLPYLYGILLLIENDEEDRKKGYNWNEVKKEAKLSIITDSEAGFATITSDSENHTLKLKKSGAIAYRFLNEVRNAFAHNRIIYVKEDDKIEINTTNLHGAITRDSFEEIIGLIMKSKEQNKKIKSK